MICLADHDIPCRSASGFILRYIVPRSAPVQLYGTIDRRPFFSKLSRFGDVLIGVGHGEEDLFAGQADDVLLKVGEYNREEVDGKFIKLLACQTGDALGPDVIRNGAKAFQGYTEDYLWVADGDFLTTPWADPMAGGFLMPVIKAINALLDGRTNEEVYEIEVEEYNRNLALEEDFFFRSLLRWNREHLVYLGSPQASIKPRPGFKFPFPPPPLPPFLLRL